MANHVSTSVYIDGYLYGVDGDYHLDIDRCSLRCLDAESGELMWREKTGGASLMAVDGKLIVLAEDGTLHIAEATPTAYVEISSCDLPTENQECSGGGHLRYRATPRYTVETTSAIWSASMSVNRLSIHS